MNRMKKVSIAAAILAAVGTVSTVAVAGNKHHHGEKHHKSMIYKKLDLTEAQRAEIKSRKEARKASMQATKERAYALKKEIKQLMSQDSLDQGRLRDLLRQKADIEADKMANKHAAGKEFRAMLTSEQRTKLDELKAKMKERKAMRMEKRQERRESRQSSKTE